eukprot:GHVR01017305.1.p1 GENE.GHVR01017305.1~~GHVR01017305.1.p1  ORF type:complete len:138 (-),score=16.05 GHVR01017305.1:331-744(-)
MNTHMFSVNSRMVIEQNRKPLFGRSEYVYFNLEHQTTERLFFRSVVFPPNDVSDQKKESCENYMDIISFLITDGLLHNNNDEDMNHVFDLYINYININNKNKMPPYRKRYYREQLDSFTLNCQLNELEQIHIIITFD